MKNHILCLGSHEKPTLDRRVIFGAPSNIENPSLDKRDNPSTSLDKRDGLSTSRDNPYTSPANEKPTLDRRVIFNKEDLAKRDELTLPGKERERRGVGKTLLGAYLGALAYQGLTNNNNMNYGGYGASYGGYPGYGYANNYYGYEGYGYPGSYGFGGGYPGGYGFGGGYPGGYGYGTYGGGFGYPYG
uniref:Uncharacterized protein n=1 Tax=Cacopsylla melanoneura TaxID=428564 RepID=A0A8D8PYN0_9HEMI